MGFQKTSSVDFHVTCEVWHNYPFHTLKHNFLIQVIFEGLQLFNQLLIILVDFISSKISLSAKKLLTKFRNLQLSTEFWSSIFHSNCSITVVWVKKKCNLAKFDQCQSNTYRYIIFLEVAGAGHQTPVYFAFYAFYLLLVAQLLFLIL